LNSSTYSLLGDALYKFKKVDKLIPFIIAQTDFQAIEVSRDNTIVGSHPGLKVEQFDKKNYLQALNEADFLDVLPANLPKLTDPEGRLFINMIQYFKTLSAPLKTPISLSMDVSAQATMATSPMVLRTTEYVSILDNNVPTTTVYEDEDMDWMRMKLNDLLVQHPPDLKRLESKFIEACTTNSAGVDPEKLRLIRNEIVNTYGNSPDVKEMAANAGVRIFDVLRVILKCCTSTDALLDEWMTTGMSGIRTQVGRRNRLIQMLASIHVCSISN